jgi:hypothetical protein
MRIGAKYEKKGKIYRQSIDKPTKIWYNIRVTGSTYKQQGENYGKHYPY